MHPAQHTQVPTTAPAATAAAPGEQTSPQEPTATAISITSRIPDFWRERPRLWFHQFNAIVDPQKASDLHKSQLLIARLKQDELRDISDILDNMPENNIFETLKNRLISVYEESESNQFNQLLNEIELGDQKPSQLLRRMQDLAKNRFPEDTIKLLWTNHLPASIRAILTTCDTGEVKLDSLAKMADRILENTRPSELAAVVKPPSLSSPNDQIINELNKLKLEISALNNKFNNNNSRDNQYRDSRGHDHNAAGTSRARSKSRDNMLKARDRFAQQKAKQGDSDYHCFYHFIYGSAARKCGDFQNCKYVSKN